MLFLDTTRFDRLSESEILRRIGALLATAIARSGHLLSRPAVPRVSGGSEPRSVDPLQLLRDPLERQVVQYLLRAGPTSPRELCVALGLSGRTVARKLARLRATGMCEVIGKTKAARYRLRTEFSGN